MQKQIKNLHKDLNITVVYVTHDQDEAMFLSDKIVLMDEGKIIQTGTCEELYTKPKNRFVANFLGECNFFTLDSGKKISIRPECLRISDDNKNDGNSFQVDVACLIRKVSEAASIHCVSHTRSIRHTHTQVWVSPHFAAVALPKQLRDGTNTTHAEAP